PQANHADGFWPYLRDPETLARPRAIPGTPGLMQRIGGIEKEDGTGNISYDPENHEKMVRLRAAKVAGIAKDIPLLEVDKVEGSRLLVLGWGGTWGVIHAGVYRARARNRRVDFAHLVHLNPFPAHLGETLACHRKVRAPELNLGQLSKLLRMDHNVDVVGLNKIKGIHCRAAANQAWIMAPQDWRRRPR